MAGNRIKGITVEIGGNTTKLQTALKGVNTEIRNTQSQLKDVETAELKLAEMYVTGYKAKLKKDTSYKGLWTVNFTLKETWEDGIMGK